MRTVAIAESEISGGEFERRTGKHRTRPRAARARKEQRVDAESTVDGELRLDERRIVRGTRCVVHAAVDRDFQVAEAMLGQV